MTVLLWVVIVVGLAWQYIAGRFLALWVGAIVPVLAAVAIGWLAMTEQVSGISGLAVGAVVLLMMLWPWHAGYVTKSVALKAQIEAENNKINNSVN